MLHLVRGLATIALVFPFVSRATRERLIRTWSDRLLAIFAMEKVLDGHVHARRGRGLVLVANHVSWIDIFVINSIQPAHFIAKAELARWPVVGWLIRGVGTLFIDRSSHRICTMRIAASPRRCCATTWLRSFRKARYETSSARSMARCCSP